MKAEQIKLDENIIGETLTLNFDTPEEKELNISKHSDDKAILIVEGIIKDIINSTDALEDLQQKAFMYKNVVFSFSPTQYSKFGLYIMVNHSGISFVPAACVISFMKNKGYREATRNAFYDLYLAYSLAASKIEHIVDEMAA